MSHRDAEELAAEIAYMQDDPSFHPRYNPKGKKDLSDKEPDSLEARIERLEFRNKKLHDYVDKLMDENHRLRKNNKELSKQITEQFRNKGAL